MSPSNGPIRVEGREQAVRALLRDLGSQLRRGAGAERPERRRLPTGLAQIDALIDGGFPGGRLCEIHGPASSGRTSVGLGLLAQATRAGEVAAVVDAADALDPASAQRAGVDLGRLLWTRPATLREAGRCCEQLLAAGGFALVLWDLAGTTPRAHDGLSTASWQKLARAASGSGTALVVIARERVTGTCAELVLEMQSARAHFEGSPALLESLEIEAVVVRHRTGKSHGSASVRLVIDAA